MATRAIIPMLNEEVMIKVEHATLTGDLTIPENARGLVLFSHGSGSSRLSPRNRYVAGLLNEEHFATMLFDLLTEREDVEYAARFNIGLLTSRLIEVTRWALHEPRFGRSHIGYFGASTGAASALRAAAALPERIKAVVSRGGRPDLAQPALRQVTAATLLIVGALDTEVIELNTKAFRSLTCEKQMTIIPGATHLFEEPGKLKEVAEHAVKWYASYLV
jgi:putative phosphoribosyl transferase